jgi:hypothetical protein
MFMRYLGGGIGHQNQESRWTPTRHKDDNGEDEMDVDSEPDEREEQSELGGDRALLLRRLQQIALDLESRPVGDSDDDMSSENDSSQEGSDDGDIEEDDLLGESDIDSGSEDEPDFGPEDGDGCGEIDDTGFGEF